MERKSQARNKECFHRSQDLKIRKSILTTKFVFRSPMRTFAVFYCGPSWTFLVIAFLLVLAVLSILVNWLGSPDGWKGSPWGFDGHLKRGQSGCERLRGSAWISEWASQVRDRGFAEFQESQQHGKFADRLAWGWGEKPKGIGYIKVPKASKKEERLCSIIKKKR